MTDLQAARETLARITRAEFLEASDRGFAAETIIRENSSRMNRRLAMLIAVGTWIIIAAVIALCSVGCVHLPHVDAKPRPMLSQGASTVVIEMRCIENDPFSSETKTIGAYAWHGSGTVIDERHVLTAYHVAGCAYSGKLRVLLPDGRAFKMVMDKEDEEHDLARLVIESAASFDLGIAPPTRGPIPKVGDTICTSVAWPVAGGNCGTVDAVSDALSTEHLPKPNDRILYGDVSIAALVVSGNSGGGVFDERGDLVGVVVEGAKPPGIGGRFRALGNLHPDWFVK